MINNIMEHIQKAALQAEKEHFKANTIIIDTELAIMNNVYVPKIYGYDIYPPMIMGLKVMYVNNLTENYDVNFIITNTNTKTIEDELTALREENEMLKEKLSKLKEILGNEK